MLKNLRLIIKSLLGAIAGLAQVYLTMALLLGFFAIFGIYLFGGDKYSACRATEDIQTRIDSNGDEVAYWPFTNEFRLCHDDDVCEEL